MFSRLKKERKTRQFNDANISSNKVVATGIGSSAESQSEGSEGFLSLQVPLLLLSSVAYDLRLALFVLISTIPRFQITQFRV